MAGTISSTGTWTALSGLTATDSRINTPSVNNIDLEALKSIHGVIHPELQQMVQLFADAYSLKFWQAFAVMFTLMKAMANSEGPTQQNTYTP